MGSLRSLKCTIVTLSETSTLKVIGSGREKNTKDIWTNREIFHIFALPHLFLKRMTTLPSAGGFPAFDTQPTQTFTDAKKALRMALWANDNGG